MVISVVGDIDPETLGKALDHLFNIQVAIAHDKLLYPLFVVHVALRVLRLTQAIRVEKKNLSPVEIHRFLHVGHIRHRAEDQSAAIELPNRRRALDDRLIAGLGRILHVAKLLQVHLWNGSGLDVRDQGLDQITDSVEALVRKLPDEILDSGSRLFNRFPNALFVIVIISFSFIHLLHTISHIQRSIVSIPVLLSWSVFFKATMD